LRPVAQSLSGHKDDAQRDARFDRTTRYVHKTQRGKPQRDAVRDREGSYRLHQHPAAAHDQQQSEDEQQMIDPEQNVLDAEHRVA
jgi:hypothetical protein